MASIAIQATDGSGTFAAYVVEPKTKPAGVVVLIQEIFGVNQAMRDIAAWVRDPNAALPSGADHAGRVRLLGRDGGPDQPTPLLTATR